MIWGIIACFASFIVSGFGDRSPYEALKQYNFPAGILPRGATGYRLNPSTGEFSAYLNGSCSFSIENYYRLNYEPEIRGLISEGEIRRLSGISVKVLVMWMNIGEVVRKGNNLEFSVGFTSASFPVENFDESPRCGCGLRCHDDHDDQPHAAL